MHTHSSMKNRARLSVCSTRRSDPWMVSNTSRRSGSKHTASARTAVARITVRAIRFRICSFFCRNTKIPPTRGTRIGSSSTMPSTSHIHQSSRSPASITFKTG